MKRVLTVLLCLFVHFNLGAEVVSSGTLIVIDNVKSKFIAPRDIRVWLPKQYDTWLKNGEEIATLYMHDGQMLFDASTTWNQQEWGVDETLSVLFDEGQVIPFIVVGIDNGGSLLRHAEYFPQKPFESLEASYQQELYQLARGDRLLFGGNNVQSDKYLKFIVKELKPMIQGRFKTSKASNRNVLLGSSMGGLISWYGLLEYPEEFGRAASISTHWPGTMAVDDKRIINAFEQYITHSLQYREGMRWYMDHGDAELDSLYPPLQDQISKALSSMALPDEAIEIRNYPGEGHNENAWRKRLKAPILYLMAPSSFISAEH